MSDIKISGIWSVPNDFQNKGVIILDSKLRGAMSRNVAREGYLAYAIKYSEEYMQSIEGAIDELRMQCQKIALITFGQSSGNLKEILDKERYIDVVIAIDPKNLPIDIDKVPVRVISINPDSSLKYPLFKYDEPDSTFLDVDITNSIARTQNHLSNFLIDILQFI